MKFIPLTKGRVALVDDEDYEKIRGYKWYLLSGYAVRHVFSYENGKRKCTPIFMHRLILNMPAELKTDHKNGNKLDNRRRNLRLATVSQNGHNKRKTSNPTSSKYKGVCFERKRNKWKVCLSYHLGGLNKTINIGRFDTEIQAAEAYNIAAKSRFGAYALLNSI